jgi:hypothetical protein
MALPKINETLKFSLTVPSTGKKVKYRPYLVKEEKVLLQAFESQDLKMILDTMCDTIASCLDIREKIEVSELATFDVEYMFLQIRAASVGENSSVMINCKECQGENKVSIDVSSVEVEVGEVENIVGITEDISVEMKYPSYKGVTSGDINELEKNDPDSMIKLVAGSIAAVLTKEERIDTSEEKPEEVVDFLDSLTASQFKKVTDFLAEMPTLKHDVKFKCEHCKADNEVQLSGLADFF